MNRLGKNKGRYCGEVIDIDSVLREVESCARESGWISHTFLETEVLRLRGYHRPVASPRFKLYLSTGIHGDEPAGPLAGLRLVRENQWPKDVEIWFCPCLNPAGFKSNTRENASGRDLNRDYRHLQTQEVTAHIRWLETLPRFDLSLIMHEDWEANGFYVYELNPKEKRSFATAMISAVSKVCPIEHAELVDNWTASEGIIRPGIPPENRPQWAEALYLITHKSDQSYTLEAPSDYPLPVRVDALAAAVRSVLDAC